MHFTHFLVDIWSILSRLQLWKHESFVRDKFYQTRVAVPSYPTSSARRECSVIHVPRALAADNFGYSHPSEYKAV